MAMLPCQCHLASPTYFPVEPIDHGGRPWREVFAAVHCGCGGRSWRVLWTIECGPTGRLLLCDACGREELVETPGWPWRAV